MMHNSPTSLLKRSHIMARGVVMPSLMLPMTSNSVQGQYLLTELDPFGGLPTIANQPFQASLIQNPKQINVSSEQDYEPAKKKRLTIDQTRSLERSFAVDNKLEPETKHQLARELGLQPRQVAIWYQNRRARTKTKELEEKYDALHMQYQGVLEANKKLEAEVIKLREVLALQEKVKLVAKDAKTFVEKKQEDVSVSALSTNREEVAFSTMERPQQQIHKQSKSKDQTVDSEQKTCASTQSKSPHNATSVARDCAYNQSNNLLKNVCETVGMPLQQEMSHLNHQVFTHTLDNNHHQHQYTIDNYHHHHQYTVDNYHHQQHQIQQPQHIELLQHFQHHYQLSCFSNLVGDVKLENYERLVLPSTSLAHFDVDDYRFNLEDETTSLYFELATQA